MTFAQATYTEHFGNGSVQCDSGYQVIGGGVYLQGNPKNLHTTAPYNNGWQAGYDSKATFTVYAVCAK